MFDKEQYAKMLRESPFGLSEVQIEKQIEIKANNHANLKKGPYVVHLEYYHGILDDQDIGELEELLGQAGLELSRHNKTGQVYANIQDYALQISIAFGPSIVTAIMQSATWDVIKAITKKSWQLIANRGGSLRTFGSAETMNFGLKIKLENNRISEFHLDSKLPPEVFDKAMEKFLEYVSSQQPEPVIPSAIPDFMTFDIESEEWGKVDVMAKFREIAEQQARERAANRDRLA